MSMRKKFVVYPNGGSWRWKPVQRRPSITPFQNNYPALTDRLKRDGAFLRILAQALLTASESQLFLETLQQFRLSNSLVTLCENLKPLINTTQKFVLLIEIHKRLPARLQKSFRLLCCQTFPNYDIYLHLLDKRRDSEVFSRIYPDEYPGKTSISRGSYRKVKARLRSQDRLNELISTVGASDVTSGICTDSEDIDTEVETDGNERTPKQIDQISNSTLLKPVIDNSLNERQTVRCIRFGRISNRNLGIGITGGREYGSDIFISVVQEGSIAASKGLRAGDRIVKVNNQSFLGLTHWAAVSILRHASNVFMYVESFQDSWKHRRQKDSEFGKVSNVHLVEMIVFPTYNGKIGCVIERMRDMTLRVMELTKDSPANIAGFRVGDHIVKIDNINVSDLSGDQIKKLTFSKRLTVLIRRYGTLNPDGTEEVTFSPRFNKGDQ